MSGIAASLQHSVKIVDRPSMLPEDRRNHL
jgi:hypothetical protein